MLETIDTKKKLDKEAYKEWFPQLKNELRELQQTARESRMPIIVILEGWHMSGKADTIRYLTEALDPRGFRVHGTFPPDEDERSRHWLYRHWIRLPERGRIVIHVRSWYGRVLEDRVEGRITPDQLSHAYQAINQTEDLLHADGHLILKYWLHISKKEQRRRLKAAEKNPFNRYIVSEDDWHVHQRYEDYESAVEEMLERTSSHSAPWTIVESGDHRYRRMKVFSDICESIVRGINETRQRHAKPKTKPLTAEVSLPILEKLQTVLDKVDLGLSLAEEEYERRKVSLQLRLSRAHQRAAIAGIPMIVVFEGWDAAGKGGAIRRLTATLDARYYNVIPISKPTPEELGHHYLWRFWRNMPKPGVLTIFDRSWYGRVMVERLEGFCTTEEWQRAYQEINEFEMQLFNGGIPIVKFWLHIGKDEQLARFTARKADPHKHWKLTDEDWRNREKWDETRIAVDDMVKKTSTTYAPWTIVEGNCKRHARVKVMETVCDVYERWLTRLEDSGKVKRAHRRK